MNLKRIVHLTRKELRQIRRDKRLLRMIFMASVMQLFVFGYGVSTDVNNVSTAILDEDRTSESREFVRAFMGSTYFNHDLTITHPDEVDALLDRGAVQLVLRIPRGFTEKLATGKTAEVQTILDGSDSMTAGIIAGYVGSVVMQYADGVKVERLNRLKSQVGALPEVEGKLRVWYNPELKSVNFMVPGILCMILLIVTMMMTSMAIVREKEIGTLEQLVVTPITSGELMIGKTIPFLLLGMADMIIVLVVSVIVFDVAVAGSAALLILLTIVFLFTTLGLGIFISTISQTQQEAMMTGFFFMLPQVLLSGFMFPIENMPEVV